MQMIVQENVQALQVTVDEDFEDGAYTGVPTTMRVPPQILEESGNTFLRITGSREDKDFIPPSESDRNRSTIRFTDHHKDMPVLTEANRRQIYQADLRVNANTSSATIFELFQHADADDPDGDGDEPYGERNGIGPTARFKGGKFYNCYNNEHTCDRYSFPITQGVWQRYTVKALWSYDPSIARLEVYRDNVLIHTITGKPTNLGPNSNRLPELKLGLYGDNATGTIDVDNIRVSTWGDPSPPGDLNNDGQVTSADLRLLVQMLLGQVTPSDKAKALAAPADRLTLGDARELMQLLMMP
jgi:hypothetical protein